MVLYGTFLNFQWYHHPCNSPINNLKWDFIRYIMFVWSLTVNCLVTIWHFMVFSCLLWCHRNIPITSKFDVLVWSMQCWVYSNLIIIYIRLPPMVCYNMSVGTVNGSVVCRDEFMVTLLKVTLTWSSPDDFDSVIAADIFGDISIQLSIDYRITVILMRVHKAD